MHSQQTSAHNFNLLNPLVGTFGLLMIPLLVMQVSSEVDWKLFDFLVMGTLLFSVGLALEVVRTKVKHTNQQILIGIVVLGAFVLIWAELAVGILGTPFAWN